MDKFERYWKLSDMEERYNSSSGGIRALASAWLPAQAVLHGVLEIVPHKPDLIVSGINYGENVGLGVTISGTVGAAMEAASLVDPCDGGFLGDRFEISPLVFRGCQFLGCCKFCIAFCAFVVGKEIS